MVKKFIAVIVMVMMMSTVLAGCLSSSKAPASSAPASSAPAASAPASSAPAAAGKKILKVSNGINDKHPAYIAQLTFKKIVEEKTKGKYEVQLYHSSQLGDDIKATESLRAGTLDMVVTSTSPLTGMVKELAIFDLPFLFPSEKVADAILDGPIGKQISDLMPAKGLVNIAWYENGYRNLTNSAREVKTPADLKGLKIRTMENPIHLAAWKALGANPAPMPFSEVFTALQQKTIDGQENPVPTIFANKFYEVNKYTTLSGHVYTPFMFLFSKKIFDTLPKEDQDIIVAAAKETAILQRQLNRKASVDNVAEMRKLGATVTELTAEQKKAFQQATASVWDQFAEKIDKDLVAKMKAEVEKLNK